MVKPLNPEDHIVESPLVGCPVAAVALCHLRSTLCQFFGIQHGTCESMLQRRNWHSAWAISLGVSCLMGDPQSSPWFFQYRILNDLTLDDFHPKFMGKLSVNPGLPSIHNLSSSYTTMGKVQFPTIVDVRMNTFRKKSSKLFRRMES